MLERIYSVLVVNSSNSFTPFISSLFPGNKFYPVKVVDSALLARRALLFRQFDIVVINSPLVDDSGLSLALEIGKNNLTSVLLLSPSNLYSEVEAKLTNSGVFSLKKPVSIQTLEIAKKWIITSSDKIKLMQEEKVKVEEKMEEIKIVNRAKWILIEDMKMSEKEAQNFIIKEAMDKSITKKEEATIIINTYRPI